MCLIPKQRGIRTEWVESILLEKQAVTEEMCRWIEAFLSVLEHPGAWLVMAVCLEGGQNCYSSFPLSLIHYTQIAGFCLYNEELSCFTECKFLWFNRERSWSTGKYQRWDFWAALNSSVIWSRVIQGLALAKSILPYILHLIHMGMTETEGACGLMSSGGFGLAETKAVCTRLATKPWINRSYCMSFSRVHCGHTCWWPVL